MSAITEFNQHLEDCAECHGGVLKSLCDVGCELLLEAKDEVPADWHPVIRMLHEQDRLEREAAANFEYYKGCDEP